jgi:hypothetical protein
MPYIANIGFTAVGGRFRVLGSIWHDPDNGKTRLVMTGIKLGKLVAVPKVDDAPFLQGDIVLYCGNSTDRTGKSVGRYTWLGRIASDVDSKGKNIYKITFDVMPMHNHPKYGTPSLYIFNDDENKEHRPMVDGTPDAVLEG